MMASMSQAQKDNKGGLVVGENKYAAWVAAMSDQMVFDALSACERNPGPLVDSTRDFYRRLLENTLKSDERHAVGKIEDYLAQQPEEAQERWLASGLVDLHSISGGTGASSAANNGTPPRPPRRSFDTHSDDELLEQFSHEAFATASSGSGASGRGFSTKEATPAPREEETPPVATSTPRSSLRSDSSEMRSRVLSPRNPEGAGGRFDLDSSNEIDKAINEVMSRPFTSSSRLFSGGISSPPAAGHSSKRTVESSESYKKVTWQVNYRESSTATGASSHLASPNEELKMNTSSGKSKKKTMFVALVVLVVAVILGYIFYANQNPESVDELEFILGTMEENGQDREAAGEF